MPDKEEYRANFLWGFPDESIEALGYEFANGKTEPYLKEVWEQLVQTISEQESRKEAMGFGQWATLNDWTYIKSKGYWVNEEEEENDKTYTDDQLYDLYIQSKQKQG